MTLRNGTDKLVPDIADPERRAAIPVSVYLLKVASRCNLNCSYCYVYNKGDDSYHDQPYRMSPATVSAMLARIATHCRENGLDDVAFIFHGGEPLLAGQEFFRSFVAQARAVLPEDITLTYAIETNGTLLNAEWLDLFLEHGIGFGISLDGSPATHDVHRVNHAGAGSYRRVRRVIDLVVGDKRLDDLFGGILTVIDLAMDPLEVYRHYREIGLKRCDFLLPDGTHDCLPPGLSPGSHATPYADWLTIVFDEWFGQDDTSFSVRLFEEIIKLLFAPGYGTDALGGGQNGLLVIETDGGIEPVDVLKICGPSYTKLGLNVQRDEIRDACSAPLVRLYQEGGARLCATCVGCPVTDVCGGGYVPHRHSSVGGFDNPSVYCRDMVKLINHIRNRVLVTIPEATRLKLGMRPISYEQASALLDRSIAVAAEERGKVSPRVTTANRM